MSETKKEKQVADSGLTKRVIFVMSTKGGVGKTTVSKSIVDLARRENHPLAVFDADTQVAQLKDIYGKNDDNPLTGVMQIDVRDKSQRGMLLNILEDYNETDILVDFPGGIINELTTIVTNMDELIETYNNLGYDVVVVIPINAEYSSMRGLQLITKTFGVNVTYVVIKNLRDFGVSNIRTNDIPDFKIFEGAYNNTASTYRSQFESCGGVVMSMPSMDANLSALIDFYKLKYLDIKGVRLGNKTTLPSEFKIVEKSQVNSFIGQMDEFVSKPILGV